MSIIKNFSTGGVGSSVQFGKRGGYINFNQKATDGQSNTIPAFQLYQNDTTTLARLQLSDPLTYNDAATKNYVDSIIQGLNLKQAVYVASCPADTVDGTGKVLAGAGNIPLTGSLDSNSEIVIDGTEVPANSRVLLKDQTDLTQNGIYVLSINSSAKTYSLARSSDADNIDEATGKANNELSSGTFVFVETGVTNVGTGWVINSPVGDITIGTDKIVWIQFSSAGVTSAGAGLIKSGVILSVNTDGSTIYTNSSGQVSVKSGTTGQVMISNGGTSAIWGQVDLTTGVSGVLPAANGGIGIGTFAVGDLLVGGSNKLTTLPIGKDNQSLNIAKGVVEWSYPSTLYSTDGIVTVQSNSASDAVSSLSVVGANSTSGSGYGTAANATINPGVNLLATGTGSDINLTLSPQNNGILLAKSGYSAYISANYTIGQTDSDKPLVPDDSIATVGFVMGKVTVPDTTKIYHTDSSGNTTAAVETNADSTNTVTVISDNSVVATFTKDNPTTTNSTNEEHLIVTSTTDEVQLYAVNNESTADVNMRLIPQNNGFIYLGTKGSGLIKSEDTYSLTLTGGDGTSSANAGDTIIHGGSSGGASSNGGNVIIRGGEATTTSGSTSTGGDTFIKDSYNNSIIQFTNNSIANAVNYFYVSNSADSVDQSVSGIHIGVSPNSTTTNVSVYMDTKGTGLVRASGGDTYTNNLSLSGNDNAFVTKKYVDSTVGGATIPDGHGLSTYTDSGVTYREVSFGTSNTVGYDASYNIVVKSGTAGTVLISQSGSYTVNEAAWDKIDLSTTDSIKNILTVASGGTGFGTYSIGDILYADTTSTLAKLSASQSSANQVLSLASVTSGSTTSILPQYSYISSLYGSNGIITLTSTSVDSATNYVNISNSIDGNNPSIGVTSSDSTTNAYLGLNIVTNASGLVYVNSTYTTALSDSKNTNSANALVTKSYVDGSIAAGGDPLLIKQVISSNYTSSMDIGVPKTPISNKVIVISEILVDVTTAMSGNSVDSMKVYVGSSTSGTLVLDSNDTDILAPDLYIKEYNISTDISGYQITAYFYDDSGNLVAPTAGNITVIVRYNIISS